jgi:hypothetical protein
MSESPSIPSTPITGHVALASQVGGHAGVETTEDGSLIIKPVLHRELQFYQSLQQDPALAALLPFTPKFLKLERTVDPTKPDSTEGIIVHPVADSKDMWCYLFFLILVCERLMVVFWDIYGAWCWRTFRLGSRSRISSTLNSGRYSTTAQPRRTKWRVWRKQRGMRGRSRRVYG